jgi:DNA-binding response OmpR family regulator
MPDSKKNILVLEDNAALLEVIKRKLEINDFNVFTATNVDDGLDVLEKYNGISAVWLDHYLFGKKNGLEFIVESRKNNSKHEELPIFVVSNTATDDKVKTYLKLGVSKYYVKAEQDLGDIIDDINKELS